MKSEYDIKPEYKDKNEGQATTAGLGWDWVQENKKNNLNKENEKHKKLFGTIGSVLGSGMLASSIDKVFPEREKEEEISQHKKASDVLFRNPISSYYVKVANIANMDTMKNIVNLSDRMPYEAEKAMDFMEDSIYEGRAGLEKIKDQLTIGSIPLAYMLLRRKAKNLANTDVKDLYRRFAS